MKQVGRLAGETGGETEGADPLSQMSTHTESPVRVRPRLSVCLWFRRRRGLSVPSKLTVARRGGILRPVRTTEYVGVFESRQRR